MDLDVTGLAAGGDGIARDASGRVTFIPGAAPGDRVRVRIVHATKSFARAQLVEVLAPGASRVEPACEYVAKGCGGCAWQHVSRPAQLAAKQQIVESALRRLPDLRVHPIDDPCPPLGWRRRARFHVKSGQVGLYAHDSHALVPLAHCPQLEPALDAAYRAVTNPPDGELVMLVGHRGDVSMGNEVVEVEPELEASANDFVQASAAGNRALKARAGKALGPGPGRVLELYAGNGNLTRAYRDNGWTVVATDLSHGAEVVASAVEALSRIAGPFDAIALDPPRTGAAEAIDGILRHDPRTVVYVSCDPATLARDAQRLVGAGYTATDAWPIDLMPQTAHVEVVLLLRRLG